MVRVSSINVYMKSVLKVHIRYNACSCDRVNTLQGFPARK